MQPEPPQESAAHEGPHQHLVGAATGGVLWQGSSFILGKLVVLGTTIVLARLLTPDDFGMVALALVFITYAEVITDLGVAQAVIYLPRSRSATDGAVAVAVLWGACLMGAAMLLAPFAASFLGRPDITTMFRVLAVSLLLESFGQVPDALLRKELMFRKRMLAELSRTVVQGLVTIALALAEHGPWAIVIGYLSGNAAWALAAWIVVDERPRIPRSLNRNVIRPLLRFGIPAAANSLLLSLVFNIDYLIIGRRLGAEALGFYTLAFRIPQVAIISVFYVLSGVAFPLYARAREDPDRLKRGYILALRVQSVYGVGVGIAFAILAPVLVPVLFGARWIPSVVPLQALALYAAFRSLGIGAVDLYKAMGRPRLAVKMSLVRLAVLVPILWISTRYGINGVSWAQAGVALALALGMQVVAARLLDLPALAPLNALAPALIAGAGVALGAGGVVWALPTSDLMTLVVATGAGALGGLLALRLFAHRFITQVRQLFTARAAT